jgi:hypothetical protein
VRARFGYFAGDLRQRGGGVRPAAQARERRLLYRNNQHRGQERVWHCPAASRAWSFTTGDAFLRAPRIARMHARHAHYRLLLPRNKPFPIPAAANRPCKSGLHEDTTSAQGRILITSSPISTASGRLRSVFAMCDLMSIVIDGGPPYRKKDTDSPQAGPYRTNTNRSKAKQAAPLPATDAAGAY